MNGQFLFGIMAFLCLVITNNITIAFASLPSSYERLEVQDSSQDSVEIKIQDFIERDIQKITNRVDILISIHNIKNGKQLYDFIFEELKKRERNKQLTIVCIPVAIFSKSIWMELEEILVSAQKVWVDVSFYGDKMIPIFMFSLI